MILNLGTILFNANIPKGGNPSWGTELGQGEGYRFSFEDMDDFITSMVYRSVPDIDAVFCPLGKGGSRADDFEYVLASIYDKVYVNGMLVKDGEFLLLIIKQIQGDNHIGRRSLKYSPRITYHDKEINQDCYDKIAHTLGLKKGAAWFIDEINVRNQDELHFTAYVLGEKTIDYSSLTERKAAMLKLRKGSSGGSTKSGPGMNPQPKDKVAQTILFGAPGTGKSFLIEQRTINSKDNTIRTTFHPDSDYSSFVGCYKPIQSPKNDEQIIYKFVPQAFTKAYIKAWKLWINANQKDLNINLIIEEINRGNCAQIFGDIFQLLDRDENGYSRYYIATDEDMRAFLNSSFYDIADDDFFMEKKFKNIPTGQEMILPPNLNLYATMNTSDQSLFPIDSAFKRRWNWEYVPIQYEPQKPNGESFSYMIDIDGAYYVWGDFIEAVNEDISGITDSEDKQLGYFFVTPDHDDLISKELFVWKVLFYLWNDVYKDFADRNGSKFKLDKENGSYSYNSFFGREGIKTELVKKFIEQFVEQDSSKSDKKMYIINNKVKCKSNAGLAATIVNVYVKANPGITKAKVVADWSGLGVSGNRQFVIEDTVYTARNYTAAKWTEIPCADGSVFVNRENWYANGNQQNVPSLISAVNSKSGLGITIDIA